jgi:hypothetical protein
MAIATGRIGYKNLFTTTGVTVTESDEVVGFESENAYDWKQYDWWKQSALGTSWLRASFASAKSADYMCVFGHNLYLVGGSIKPQYSTDAGATWLDATTAVTPTTSKTQFIGFTSVSAADWRCLVVTTTGQSIISGIMIGEAMVFNRGLQTGFSPATLSPDVEYKTGKSEMGVNLGGSVKRTGISGDIQLKNLDPTWVRTDWELMIDHFNLGYPAAFAWDYVDHNDESALIWVTKQIPSPNYSSTLYMDVSLSYEGIE